MRSYLLHWSGWKWTSTLLHVINLQCGHRILSLFRNSSQPHIFSVSNYKGYRWFLSRVHTPHKRIITARYGRIYSSLIFKSASFTIKKARIFTLRSRWTIWYSFRLDNNIFFGMCLEIRSPVSTYIILSGATHRLDCAAVSYKHLVV